MEAALTNLKHLSAEKEYELSRIVENIKNAVSVKQIILFGSHAYGNPGENSDFDLCIITEDKRRKIEVIMDVQEAAYEVSTHPLDILVYKPEDFDYRSDSVTSLEKTISGKGIVLYG